MKSLNRRAPRIAGLLALALGAVALLAVSGVAVAKDHGRDDNGGHHGRHHDHGRHHGRHFEMRESGTISSFDTSTGKLTIALRGGGTVTGLVTKSTEIKCEGVDDRRGRRDHGGDNSGPGSGEDNGGQVEPGDDHGGRGEPEPGDDHGGQNEPGDDNGGATPSVGTPAGEASCSVASLVPGTVVGDAELRFENGSAVFEEVELGHHS
jgi:hypothetical protein